MKLKENLKEPYVSPQLADYLREAFSMSTLLEDPLPKNNDERIGMLRGVQMVLNHLDFLSAEKEE